MKRNKIAIVVTLLCAALLCAACGNFTRATTMHLVKTQGAVDVSDNEGDHVELAENLNLYSGYNMETQKESYAWIDLDSVKLTKMDAESEVEIRKIGRLLEIFVNSGGLYFNITEPLAEDETLNIRTSNIAIGIRGTCGWVRVTDESHMSVYLLEGTVECSVMDDQGNAKTSTVSGGEVAEIAGGEIQVSPFKEPAIPVFVLDELSEDEAQCRKIYEDSGLDIALARAGEDSGSASGSGFGEGSSSQSGEGFGSGSSGGGAFGDGGSGSGVFGGEAPGGASSEEDGSDVPEGMWATRRAEWSGNFNDSAASLTVTEEYVDTSSFEGGLSWDEFSNVPPSFRQVEVGFWFWRDTVKELRAEEFGEATAAFNMDGYEWRILAWGGPEESEEDSALGTPRYLLALENTYWTARAEDSKNWNRTNDYYYTEIDEGLYLECITEYDFAVTMDGTDYTDCRFFDCAITRLAGEYYFKYILVRVPEGYDGILQYILYASKEENGEIAVDSDSYLTILF